MTDRLTEVIADSARGSMFLISGTALSTVIMAIATILIGRLLGPELYGQYVLAFLLPQLLYLFTALGIDQGIIRFTSSLRAAGEIDRLRVVIRTCLILRICVALFVFLISLIFADSFSSVLLQRPELTFYVRVASASILFQAIFATATSALVGLDRTEYNAFAMNIQAVAKTLTSIALVVLGFGVFGAVTGQVLSYVVAAAASLCLLFFIRFEKRTSKINGGFASGIKELLRYSAPLYVSLLLTGSIPLFKSFFLGVFVTDSEVGNYKAAVNFISIITILASPIVTILLPAYSKLESSAVEKIKIFFKLVSKYTAMLIVPVAVVMIIFSKEIVQIIYGSAFESASLFLAVESALYFLVGLGYLNLASFFNGLGKTRTTLKMSLIIFFMFMILSPILTWAYSVVGLIVAFLIGSAAGTIYGSYRARKEFKVEFDMSALLRIYLVSAVSGIIPLVILRISISTRIFNVAVGFILYVFTYMTLLPATRTISSNELKTAKSILEKIKPLRILAQPVIDYQQRILGFWKT